MRVTLPFRNPIALGLSGANPTLSSDGAELWLTQGPPSKLASALRVEGKYPTAIVAAFNSAQGDMEAALTADNQLLAYSSDRSGSAVYQRQRGTLPGEWLAETLAVTTSFSGFDISRDGLTLYLIDFGKLRIMKRASRDAVFETTAVPPQSLDNNADYPTMSFDEREIIFNVSNGLGGSRLIQASRKADESKFDAATVLDLGCGNAGDADFSPDAMTLVYTCNGQIFVARR